MMIQGFTARRHRALALSGCAISLTLLAVPGCMSYPTEELIALGATSSFHMARLVREGRTTRAEEQQFIEESARTWRLLLDCYGVREEWRLDEGARPTEGAGGEGEAPAAMRRPEMHKAWLETLDLGIQVLRRRLASLEAPATAERRPQ